MIIRLLQSHDIDALYDFEIANRNWFEQHIPGRGDAFYTKQGIEQHVADFLHEYQQGTMYPSLIWHEQHIIGRANLRKITADKKSAELGYRIAQDQCNRGWASRSVSNLLEVARELKIENVYAYVYTRNLASARVLEKQGFANLGWHAAKSAGERDYHEFVFRNN
jgi:ribosomal-protein-alanine N-acetyltransferase